MGDYQEFLEPKNAPLVIIALIDDQVGDAENSDVPTIPFVPDRVPSSLLVGPMDDSEVEKKSLLEERWEPFMKRVRSESKRFLHYWSVTFGTLYIVALLLVLVLLTLIHLLIANILAKALLLTTCLLLALLIVLWYHSYPTLHDTVIDARITQLCAEQPFRRAGLLLEYASPLQNRPQKEGFLVDVRFQPSQRFLRIFPIKAKEMI